MAKAPSQQTVRSANRYEAVRLSFNLGIPAGFNLPGNQADCNSGGSVICDPGTGGCGSGGMTCVGTSCSGSSATLEQQFDSRILVARDQLAALRKELIAVVNKFSR